MWIDVLFLLFILLAVFKGLRNGLILAVFSTAAFIVGLAAAVKLSAAFAGYLKDSINVSDRWLPVLAFIVVFLGVALLVRGLAKLLEAAVDLAMMGWLNKLAGVLLYALLYTIILSIMLFYAVQVHLLSARNISASVVYPVIRPWGAAVMDGFGKIFPIFKGMFVQLEDFFERLHR